MSEKITIRRFDNPVEWALIAAITPKPAGDEVASRHVPGEPLEVDLRVQGVEVPFSKVIDRLMEQFDYQVKKAALELLKERFANVESATCRVTEALDRAVEKFTSDLGLE